MNKKEIEKLYGKDIFRLHSVGAIANLIKHSQDNNLSLDKIIIKQKLIELKKYSQINHSRMTLERYVITYDYYAQREYKKYIKKKCSEWCSTKYNHDTKSLKHFIKKCGNSEIANEEYKKSCYNCGKPLRIQHYIDKGMSEKDAKIALKDRQSTFSLSKCVKKYGKEKGEEIWEARQQKWLNTLNSKSKEEIDDINRRKCEWMKDEAKLAKAIERNRATREKLKKENPELYHQRFHGTLPLSSEAEKLEGHLYYLHIYNDNVSYYKIGITKFSDIKYRWNINKFKENHFNFDVLFFKKCRNYKDAYIQEQNILRKFSKYRIFVDYGFFKSSEVFNREIFEGKYDEINI